MKFWRSFLLLVSVCFAAGCASLYDGSFEADHPPIYLNALPESEPVLSKITVGEVAPDSPPARAGLQAGDEIIAIDDAYIRSSAKRLYHELLHAFEKQMGEVEFDVRRGAQRLTAQFDAKYIPLIRYRFGYQDENGPRSVQFIKEYVSEEGHRYEALYDFGERIKVRTSCHWWGEQILVIELHFLNDLRKKVLSLNPEDIVVSDRYDFVLKPLSTEEIVGRIYNVGFVNSMLSSPLHWRKRKAVRINSEINGLYWDLNQRRLKHLEIPPQKDGSGVLMYEFDASQSPVTIEVRAGKKKFIEKFEMQQASGSQIFYPFHSSPFSEEESWLNFTTPG